MPVVVDDPPPRTAVSRAFLRGFFHDLATPLSAVSLHLEGADRRLRRGADAAESVATAKTELAKALELFELGRELLLFEPEKAARFDFDEFVAAVALPLGLDGGRIRGTTGGQVTGDRRALEAALSALLVNAVEAAGVSSVSIRRERAGGDLKVLIENPGSLKEAPDSLFSPRAAGAGKNWGMGLSRARLHAADAAGTVTLHQEGERVVATLELPEAEAEKTR